MELVIADPQAWPGGHLEALLRAMARYVPDAGIWCCADGQLVPLSRAHTPAEDSSSGDATAAAEPAHVTTDEIEMLLEANLTPAESTPRAQNPPPPP
jgi:hypothetical protein